MASFRGVGLFLALLDGGHGFRLHENAHTGGPMYFIGTPPKLNKVDPDQGATIEVDPGSQKINMVLGIKPATGIAWGYVRDTLDKTGWIEVHMQTTDRGGISNDLKQYSAGFIEGCLTAARMSQFYSNFYQMLVKDSHNEATLNNIKNMFADELKYLMRQMNVQPGAISLEPPDPYWQNARYTYMQLWGILEGYNTVALQSGVAMLSMVDMLMINHHAELGELMQAYTPEMMDRRRRAQAMKPGVAMGGFLQTKKQGHHNHESHQTTNPESLLVHNSTYDRDWENIVAKKGHCTAFVRLGTENNDLFVGHTTWDDYSKMIKMFKYYDFSLPSVAVASSKVAMSSYPGCVSSTDDWYMLSSGLVVADTTLEILNPNIYDRIPEFPSNKHIPNFIHTMTVNRMAKTAADWISLFSERNSGTNNAQWLIVDYNQFTPNSPLPDLTFWVLEQVPSIIHKADMSLYLRTNGFFASYNRPTFDPIREASGHNAAEAKYGPLFSYENAPRGQIFQYSGPDADTLEKIRKLMQRNHYPNEEAFKDPPGRKMDPILVAARIAAAGVIANEPGHAVAARMDLDGTSRLPNGAIDSKVINNCLFKSFQCQAISGPTHDTQKPFRWQDDDGKDLFGGWPHLGLPNVYDFNWVQMTPSRQVNGTDDMSC